MEKTEKDKKSYLERVEERMGECYDEKPLKKPSNSFKNNMGEVDFIPETDVGILKRKNKKKINNYNKTSKVTKVITQKKDGKKKIQVDFVRYF